MVELRQPVASTLLPAAGVRALALGGAALTLLSVGGGLALQELAGVRSLAVGGPTTLALSVGLFGALIMWLQPRNRIGALLLVTGVCFGLGVLASGILDYGARRGGVPVGLEQAAFAWIWFTAVLTSSWALLILWFPDGTFPSAGWRRWFVAGATVNAVLAVAVWLFGPGVVYDFFSGTEVPPGIYGPFATESWRHAVTLGDLILLFPLISLAALAQRYRGASAVVRRQIGWLIVPAAIGILLQLARLPLSLGGADARTAGAALSMLGQPVTVVGATVGILRYRLWEIELVISRALVYAALWAALTVLLLVPALAAGLLVGGRAALTAVVLALLVTVVFQPARRRLEHLAERLVYRQRARPHAFRTDLWELMRTATSLEDLGRLVSDAVRSGLEVEWCGVWLATAGGALEPLGVSGAPAGPVVLLSPTTRERLHAAPGVVPADEAVAELEALSPSEPAVVVPLLAGSELVGVLACGRRPGDPLGARDFELLETLARGLALRLRNLRLESQLRARLKEIELQAEELRRSRQRLVTAQDEERRRIERDVHDGVQQQLVSLATRLQRLAGARDPLLGDLAAEAEQAVFALQELARGIFPSVLADQGLTAALRTQAARMPLAVRIDADENIAGRRLEPELEAALYFVALEGLANVQKHAPGATASARLALEDGLVVLEVVDDGPGFATRGSAGTGLQNMADRVAAAGGHLTVDGTRGTRVRAEVPAGGALRTSSQPPAADSRR